MIVRSKEEILALGRELAQRRGYKPANAVKTPEDGMRTLLLWLLYQNSEHPLDESPRVPVIPTVIDGRDFMDGKE